jgi:hypothetical protein
VIGRANDSRKFVDSECEDGYKSDAIWQAVGDTVARHPRDQLRSLSLPGLSPCLSKARSHLLPPRPMPEADQSGSFSREAPGLDLKIYVQNRTSPGTPSDV